MTLTLHIENETSLADGGPLSVSIKGKRGLDIGRDPYLDWTLPDPSKPRIDCAMAIDLSSVNISSPRRWRRKSPSRVRPRLRVHHPATMTSGTGVRMQPIPLTRSS